MGRKRLTKNVKAETESILGLVNNGMSFSEAYSAVREGRVEVKAEKKKRERKPKTERKIVRLHETKEAKIIHGIFTIRKNETVIVELKNGNKYKGRVKNIDIYNGVSFTINITNTKQQTISEEEISHIWKMKQSHLVMY